MRLILLIIFVGSWLLLMTNQTQALTACPVKPWPRRLITSPIRGLIIPHHQISQAVWSQALIQLAKQKPSIIYLLSPNHSDHGPLVMTSSSLLGTKTNRAKYLPSYNQLLKINSVYDNQQSVIFDQGVAVPLIVMKQYLPDVPIIPIMLRKQTPATTLQNLSRYLSQADSQAVILASLDFSHDLQVAKAQQADQITMGLIQKHLWSETMYLSSDYVDGPTALTTLGLTMDQWLAQPQLIWQGHAGQFLSDCLGPTTTYQVWTFI